MIARALVDEGRRVGIYKPAASGCQREGGELVADDAVTLWEAAGRPGELCQVCPQQFSAPLAPPRAAALEGRRVDPQLLRTGVDYWRQSSDIVIVEGAGGLMSPLSDEDYNIDLAIDLGYPLLIVAANELGVINATLQTIIAARAKAPRLSIAGVVLNQVNDSSADESLAFNAQDLACRLDAPLLATIGYRQLAFSSEVDWFALAGA
jgi:dethiobiotin synthetase